LLTRASKGDRTSSSRSQSHESRWHTLGGCQQIEIDAPNVFNRAAHYFVTEACRVEHSAIGGLLQELNCTGEPVCQLGIKLLDS
jgi:hypothetical protein